MPGKYRIILFYFILFIFRINSIETERNISIFFIYEKNLNEKQNLIITYLIDSYESNNSNKYKDINFKFDHDQYDLLNVKRISNDIFSKGGNCFYKFDVSSDKSDYIEIQMYTSTNELLFNTKYYIDYKKVNEFILNTTVDSYYNSLDLYLIKKNNSNSLFKFKNSEYQFIHDFPYVNFSLSAVSIKIYFDGRTTTKMFSFFPLELRFTYYPLKYFETGLFIKFDVGDIVYKYYDLKYYTYNNFDSPFDFSYGIFCGFSLFTKIAHYSVGVQFYNIYYNLSNTNYLKPNNINSLFLPQFSLYQKLDIKLFKFFNYSVFVNLKTMPLFYLDSNMNFFSKPFNYDFLIIDFSLIGFSLTF